MSTTMTRVKIAKYRLNADIVRDYLNERFKGYVIDGQDVFDVQVLQTGFITFRVPGYQLLEKDKNALLARRVYDEEDL